MSDDAASQVAVFRLGGSLLTLPDLLPRLVSSIHQLPSFRPLLIVGGGAAADAVRSLHDRFAFTQWTAHWLAIQAMSDNAKQLCRLDRRLTLVDSRIAAGYAWQCGLIPALNTTKFLEAEEQQILQNRSATHAPPSADTCLPASWEVTSDSIAAWIAARWPARSLWLLKSCDAHSVEPACLAEHGQVDRCFPRYIAADCRLHWVNLRRGSADVAATGKPVDSTLNRKEQSP